MESSCLPLFPAWIFLLLCLISSLFTAPVAMRRRGAKAQVLHAGIARRRGAPSERRLFRGRLRTGPPDPVLDSPQSCRLSFIARAVFREADLTGVAPSPFIGLDFDHAFVLCSPASTLRQEDHGRGAAALRAGQGGPGGSPACEAGDRARRAARQAAAPRGHRRRRFFRPDGRLRARRSLRCDRVRGAQAHRRPGLEQTAAGRTGRGGRRTDRLQPSAMAETGEAFQPWSLGHDIGHQFRRAQSRHAALSRRDENQREEAEKDL